METRNTDFGFANIDAALKQGRVGEIFSSVAPRYDLLNDILSVGAHRLWKAQMIDALYLAKKNKIIRLLDVAGGTGDIARAALKRARRLDQAIEINLIDINREMLAAGRDDIAINKITANAEALPIADKYADIYTIAFGLRNITNRANALTEAYRVLDYGGRFVCLEFSHLTAAPLQKLYDSYSFNIMPQLGKFFAQDEAAYRYLAESIRRFPPPEKLRAEIAAAGFARTGFMRLSGGIAALHYGWRI